MEKPSRFKIFMLSICMLMFLWLSVEAVIAIITKRASSVAESILQILTLPIFVTMAAVYLYALSDAKHKRKTRYGQYTGSVGDLINSYRNREIEEKEFYESLGDVVLYYADPTGVDREGNTADYTLPAAEGCRYLPVFDSYAHTRNYYVEEGRGRITIKREVARKIIQTLEKDNRKRNTSMIGLIIEPSLYEFTIEASELRSVIYERK